MRSNAMAEKIEQRGKISWHGILAGAGAALLYTAANVFLRQLAVNIDFVTVVFLKAITTAAIFVPWLFFIRRRSGQRVLPQGKYFWIMLLGAIQAQFFGNIGQQISFGVIGIAVSVPVYIGSLVSSSAFLGYLFLKENISLAVASSLGILVCAVALLSCGGEAASDSLKNEQALAVLSDIPFAVGIAAGISCGVAFAILGVCIRSVLASGVPPQTPIVIVSLTGVIGFGMTVLARGHFALFGSYDLATWGMMVGAGLCNAAAFYCLSWALKLLPVVYVNAINVSQVALAAAIGVLLFSEPLSAWLAVGLALMVFGFGLLARFTANANHVDELDQA